MTSSQSEDLHGLPGDPDPMPETEPDEPTCINDDEDDLDD